MFYKDHASINNMSETINPYETPVTTQEPEIVEFIDFHKADLVDTKKIAFLSKVMLWVYAVVFFFVAVWNLKLAYEYDLTDDWEGLFFMFLIEEDGSFVLWLCFSCVYLGI